MSLGKLHADEVDTDAALVRRLIAAQFPHWANRPVAPVPSSGTDNALYRLGDDLVVRLPRTHRAAGQVAKEQQWLPRLASYLPLAIPVPLAMGRPGAGYPWQWSVYRWLDGEHTRLERLVNPRQAALDLAHFVAALRRIDSTDGPPPGEHNSWRGVPLAARADAVAAALAGLEDEIDTTAAAVAWAAALAAPTWDGPPRWIHGDLQATNLLAADGRLTAVIDFGCLGVGDPACDLLVAWEYLDAATRPLFRAALAVDDATWARGRGWALSKALIALPYYRHTNPGLVASSLAALAAVLAE